MDSAFYEPAGAHAGAGVGADTYVATAATIGPWSADAQHGGPPSALAARAIERHEPDDRQRLARVVIDILRPVPVGKVSLRTTTARPGRRVSLVDVVMEADGLEVLHARGWRIERPAGHVPPTGDTGPSAPLPLPPPGDGLAPEIFSRSPGGYLAAIEWRFTPGEAGPAPRAGAPAPDRGAWTRPRLPLLPGEDASPMVRSLLVADSGSGVGAALPASQFIFVNVDLTVVLTRDPAGEWLLLEPSTMIGSSGTGLTMTTLSDQLGACGRGLQTLLVAPR